MSDRSDYLLGSGDAELARLAFQHRVWGAEAYALWERAGFGFGHSVLDLGCGPGFATLDLAHLVGAEGRVIAADAAPRFLDHSRRLAAAHGLEHVETVEVDALALDLSAAAVPEGGLDGAYARWLLCFLEEPERAVAGVARHLRRGGRFAVSDYFNYRAFTLMPRSAPFDRVVRAVEAMWRRGGGSLEVGGRLPGHFRAAGLEVVDLRQVARTARPGSPLWTWPETFFRGFLPRLVEADLVSADDEAAFWRDWHARAEDPDAFLVLPPLLDVVGEKL